VSPSEHRLTAGGTSWSRTSRRIGRWRRRAYLTPLGQLTVLALAGILSATVLALLF
jgi:hypothetical protein